MAESDFNFKKMLRFAGVLILFGAAMLTGSAISDLHEPMFIAGCAVSTIADLAGCYLIYRSHQNTRK